MKKFEMIELNDRNTLLIQTLVSESPFEFLSEIQDELRNISFTGNVIIDELLHSGNNEERFIGCEIKDGVFINNSFHFLKVKKQDPIRQHIGDYLRKNPEELRLSGLTAYQIDLIKKECVV